jgi:aminoglycoside 3-N-acetyltransferase
MPLPDLTHAQFAEALNVVTVQSGDGLLVHSALQLLGRPDGGLEMVLEALLEAVGSEGTIAVPTFPFTFNRGIDYDPANTPSKGMGAFSEFVRQQPDALRTSHPMQSLAVIGKQAADLARRDTLSAFGDGSAFDRMVQLGFKLLLLGADIQAASIVHYSEQRANVPYRYWKDFSGRIKLEGQWQPRTYRMFVRDLKLNPELKLTPIQRSLDSMNLWHSYPLNFGEVACCRLMDFVAATDTLLAADPWALVANRPEKASGN